jgi:O-antigen/teichoic acid export membrane protein
MSTTTTNVTSNLSSTEKMSLLCEIISYVTGLLLTALLTNHLSTADYSTVALGVYTLSLVYPFVMRGAYRTVFTYLGTYLSESTSTDANALLAWELRVAVVSGGSVIALLTIASILLYFFDRGFYSTDYSVVLAFLWLLPMMAMKSLQGDVLLCLKQYRAYFVCNVASQPAWCMIIVGLYVLVIGKLDFTIIVCAYLLSYLITVLGQSIWINLQPNTVGFATLWGVSITSADKSIWRKNSLELFASLELVTIQTSIGVYLLKFFTSDPGAIGIYSVVSTIANVFYLVSSALSTILSPLVSEGVSSTAGEAQLQKTVNSINGVQLLLGSILYAVLFVFSDKILLCFGSQYQSASLALRVFSGLCLLTMFVDNGLTILSYSGNANKSMFLNAFCVLLVMISGSLGSYYYDVTGLLIAVGLSIFVANLIACFVVRKLYTIKVATLF